ncbi:MAG: hypothetical protein JJ971_06570 [Balneolaceae bacterium]|nr:hypothetical protein [Balneolaceae bacterium]MBO6546038.1 hypothetical protein [Balneolaceae bacterium]MBO6647434.1 hypothetical protein [Balneolaceae bacterium]
MDREKAKYIFNYYSDLFNEKEKKALKHYITLYKSENYDNPESYLQVSDQQGWISRNSEVLSLLENGYESFQLNTASRIIKDSGEFVFLNTCIKCNQLARTPIARQCHHCGYDWHDMIVAKFKFYSAKELNKGNFYILGEIKSGLIKIGNYIDLVITGVNLKPRISAIEFVNYGSHNSKNENNIALGIDELNTEQKEFLKSKNEIYLLLDILYYN